jgi:uncharacterized membrane-anchored protein
MNKIIRQVILFCVALVIFGVVDNQVYRKEMTLASGQIMLLELAPLDPRSLMQGDYMALRYVASRTVEQEGGGGRDGHLVMSVDENNVATLRRVHEPGQPLGAGEHLLRFRKRGKGIRLGAESFFFQEGAGAQYEKAKYGELRVDDAGNSVLVGLRGKDLERLGPAGGK